MSGSIRNINNRVNQNRSLKPSKRARFKGNNRDTIYSDTLPSLTELTFKRVSKTELRKIKEKIKNKARKDRIKEMYIFPTVALALLTTLYFLLK